MHREITNARALTYSTNNQYHKVSAATKTQPHKGAVENCQQPEACNRDTQTQMKQCQTENSEEAQSARKSASCKKSTIHYQDLAKAVTSPLEE